MKVVVGAHANCVLTEPARDGGITVVGVEFSHEGSGKTYTINAKKEVALCAGYVDRSSPSTEMSPWFFVAL